MCDVCVVNSVKERMLSRRNLFKAAAGLAAAGAATTIMPAPAAFAATGTMDLTHTLSPEFPTYDGKPGIKFNKQFDFAANGYNLNELVIGEHSGTHIDAPLHFSADGLSVDALPITDLIVPVCVIDIRERAAGDADTQLTPDDITAWVAKNGPIPERACVAMLSGWGDKVATPGFRNADDKGGQHYPGFHIEATKMLLETTKAGSIGVDTLSLDHGASADFATHYAWLPAGRYGIECLANLDKIPAAGATIIVGAPKFKGGTGGPARVFAMT
ncbi:MAG: cyclase family protein, partial [Notoacmeibacter sp.]